MSATVAAGRRLRAGRAAAGRPAWVLTAVTAVRGLPTVGDHPGRSGSRAGAAPGPRTVARTRLGRPDSGSRSRAVAGSRPGTWRPRPWPHAPGCRPAAGFGSRTRAVAGTRRGTWRPRPSSRRRARVARPTPVRGSGSGGGSPDPRHRPARGGADRRRESLERGMAWRSPGGRPGTAVAAQSAAATATGSRSAPWRLPRLPDTRRRRPIPVIGRRGRTCAAASRPISARVGDGRASAAADAGEPALRPPVDPPYLQRQGSWRQGHEPAPRGDRRVCRGSGGPGPDRSRSAASHRNELDRAASHLMA